MWNIFFQCDHNQEFDNTFIHYLFATNDIQFRFSYSRTSQQMASSREWFEPLKILFAPIISKPTFHSRLHSRTYPLHFWCHMYPKCPPFHQTFQKKKKKPLYTRFRTFRCICYWYTIPPSKLTRIKFRHIFWSLFNNSRLLLESYRVPCEGFSGFLLKNKSILYYIF